MANFTAGTSFSDGVTNDVTAAKLNALVADAVPTSNLSLNSTTGTIATFNSTTGTIATLNSTTGTIATLNSTTPTFLGAITASTNTINVGSGQIYKDATGNVGIGTATAHKTLTVGSNDATAYISAGGNNVNLTIASIGSTGSVIFKTGGTNGDASTTTERLRIDSSGNVLVGTTDAGTTTGVGLKFTASATIPLMAYVIDTANGVSSNYHIYNINATNNGYRFYVNANGGISNFSANNVNLSDERLKTNINPSGNYLDKICSIPVKTFNYKDQGEDTEKTIGVLAQEVEAHIPELINNDGFGETPADGIPLKTIYQTDLQYVLMRCVQELKAENDSLKSRIEALEAK